jgi:hypothetical protein
MTRIVTYAHRYKPPPRKRKAVALEVPAITPGKGRAGNDNRAAPALLPTDGKKSAPVIVTTKSRRASVFGDAPDITPDEHRKRGEAADALWRELVRRATEDK